MVSVGETVCEGGLNSQFNIKAAWPSRDHVWLKKTTRRVISVTRIRRVATFPPLSPLAKTLMSTKRRQEKVWLHRPYPASADATVVFSHFMMEISAARRAVKRGDT